MALKSDGTVWTWGSNSSGQLGTGSALLRNSSPAQVPNLNSVIAIASGQDHNLAVKSDGTVWAWGDNKFGALGDGSTEARNTPVQVQSLDSVIHVSIGNTHSLALKGTVWAWGSNGGGELGDGSNIYRNTPVQVKGISSVISIAAGKSFGFSHSLALKSDGTVWAWGNNVSGKLGDGTTTGSSWPVPVIHLDSVTAISSTTHISSDGFEYSTAGLPEGYTAEWSVRGHTIDDYSSNKKVIVYVSIKYDNH
ncbi:Regulator of chromosome condensation (RCC1) repeat-containing protein [Paenibacillus sp. UNC496MF]|nr:Regulator of chromosome condensation (RCC1) repeat-containing protein [Paenibacillus sp. UNC496MF]